MENKTMSEYKYVLSAQTRQRYWLAMMLVFTGLAVTFSSIYFLYFPVGYQGGRNPDYNTVLLFSRQSWELIHLWAGIGMILVLFLHIPVHRKWITAMYKRCFKRDVCKVGRMNWRARFNIIVDAIAALSFIFVTASGIYLLFTPSGKYAAAAPVIFFDYRAWDVIHTWSGVIMIIASLVHFLIHWNWVTNVSAKALKKEKVSVPAS
jgi:hypothetical protein